MRLVSVVISIYNMERYVAAAIRSVLEQTYSRFELLLVDDGSTDSSLEQCRRFKDSRIRLIRQKNRGAAGAKNTGLRCAQGDYVALLDADDLWMPQKLEKHVAHLERDQTVGLSFSYSAMIDAAGRPLGLRQIPRKLTNITPAYVLCRNPVGNGSSPVIRRETMEAIRFRAEVCGRREEMYFDESLHRGRADATDTDCWLRIALHTPWRLEGLPEVLTFYRIHTLSVSAATGAQLQALEEVIEKTRRSAPALIAACGSAAKAYHLRYIARRAVSQGDGSTAVEMVRRARRLYWRIWLEEPKRTAVTWLAAHLAYWLPTSWFGALKNAGLRWLARDAKKIRK